MTARHAARRMIIECSFVEGLLQRFPSTFVPAALPRLATVSGLIMGLAILRSRRGRGTVGAPSR
jgi:hypothetical protein